MTLNEIIEVTPNRESSNNFFVKNKDVILVVDIQNDYSNQFDSNYLEQISCFLNKYKKSDIVGMIDLLPKSSKGCHVPKNISKYFSTYISKTYSTPMALEILSYLKDENDYLEDFSKIQNFGVKYYDNLCFAVIPLSKHRVGLELICNKYLITLNKWKKNNNRIVLVGGGLNHCVWKTAAILQCFGIEYLILEDLCYSIEEEKRQNKYLEGLRNRSKFLKNNCKDYRCLYKKGIVSFLSEKQKKNT